MNLEQFPFEISVLLGKAELPMDAYLELKEGDILLLDQKVGEPFQIQVGSETGYLGTLGLLETRKAVKIDERIYPK